MPSPAVPQIFSPTRKALGRLRSSLPEAREYQTYRFDEWMARDILERLEFVRHTPVYTMLDGLANASYLRSGLPHPCTFEHNRERDLDTPAPFAPASFDTVISIGSLDSVNDLPGALIQIRELLKPGGMAIASFVGGASLPRLREAMLAADGQRPAARLHPMIDTRACAGLLQRAGWKSPVIDSHTITARYRSLMELVHDLRAHGWSNSLTSVPPALTKAALHRAEQTFASHADDAGEVSETFEIITLTGWREGTLPNPEGRPVPQPVAR